MILTLFFSYGVSLKDWIDTGLLQREKLIYEWLVEQGFCDTIYWVTYGEDDATLARDLHADKRLSSKIKVLSMPGSFNSKVGRMIYSFCSPLVHKEKLKSVDIYKTNQLEGSWTAVLAKKIFKKSLLVRCGYVWSIFARNQNKRRQLDLFVNIAEKFAYKNADHCAVSSMEALSYVEKKYNIAQEKITVIRNLIDTSVFRKFLDVEKRPGRFVFVGRLHPQKNLVNLIKAFHAMQYGLDIYGSGQEKTGLRQLTNELGADVQFKGVVNNSQLPEVLNRYEYFILPSLYEGMPKALLEAMACGLVCIGTDVPGIREVIQDGYNGYLIPKTDSAIIGEYVSRIVSQDNKEIADNAVKAIEHSYALESIAQQEKQVLLDLMNKRTVFSEG